MSNGSRAYRRAIDLNFPLERLLDNVRRYIAESYEAVKIKVGQKDMAEDFARAEAVRTLLGPSRPFMVDANYCWSVDQAIRAAQGYRPLNVLWFEEPTIPDDCRPARRNACRPGRRRSRHGRLSRAQKSALRP